MLGIVFRMDGSGRGVMFSFYFLRFNLELVLLILLIGLDEICCLLMVFFILLL